MLPIAGQHALSFGTELEREGMVRAGLIINDTVVQSSPQDETINSESTIGTP